MSAHRLEVRAVGARVGRLERRADGGLRFHYDPSWARFAISHSLPLRAEAFETEADRFFGNLLPEGGLRSAVCRRLRIGEDNDFELLAALGRECAGALEIVDADAPPRDAPELRPLRDQELERWSRIGGYASAIGEELRLSLAGAQDKVGVVLGGERLLLPQHGAASTHLLKLPNRDFAALPENEALVLELARRVGLPVVVSRLWTRTATAMLLIERFDRIAGDPIVRLHQEDLCQALGLDRRRKYEHEGGPSFAQCFSLVMRTSARPTSDARVLLDWLAFCLVVGNRDNHGKNLAVLRKADGSWQLAPLYDLVCTTAYDRLSRRLAMRIGGRDDGGNLPAVAWHDEAGALGIKAKYLVGLVEAMTDAVAHELPGAVATIAAQLGRDDALVAVRQSIGKGIRAARRGLRTTIK